MFVFIHGDAKLRRREISIPFYFRLNVHPFTNLYHHFTIITVIVVRHID